VGILLFDLAMEIALTSMLYQAGNRSFQDEFGSRRVADRSGDKAVSRRVQRRRRPLLEGCIYFFIAAADAFGYPTRRARETQSPYALALSSGMMLSWPIPVPARVVPVFEVPQHLRQLHDGKRGQLRGLSDGGPKKKPSATRRANEYLADRLCCSQRRFSLGCRFSFELLGSV
jgi:hypothetical protein